MKKMQRRNIRPFQRDYMLKSVACGLFTLFNILKLKNILSCFTSFIHLLIFSEEVKF